MSYDNELIQKYSQLASAQYNLPKVDGVIIEIGYTGCRVCFVNWSVEEAKKKYMEIEELKEWDNDINISEIVIKDGIFRAYDIYQH